MVFSALPDSGPVICSYDTVTAVYIQGKPAQPIEKMQWGLDGLESTGVIRRRGPDSGVCKYVRWFHKRPVIDIVAQQANPRDASVCFVYFLPEAATLVEKLIPRSGIEIDISSESVRTLIKKHWIKDVMLRGWAQYPCKKHLPIFQKPPLCMNCWDSICTSAFLKRWG